MRRESPQSSERDSTVEDFKNSSNNSDGESGEKPVREKLRDTKIEGQTIEEEISADASLNDGVDKPEATTDASGNRQLQRKRSIEDVEGASQDADKVESGRHVRKRSREAIPGSDIPIVPSTSEEKMDNAPAEKSSIRLVNGSKRSATPDTASDPMDEEKKSGLTSPKNKRRRDEFLREDEETKVSSGEVIPVLSTAVVQEEQKAGSDKTDSDEERKTKRSRDSSSPPSAKREENVPPKADPVAAKVSRALSLVLVH